MTLALVTVPPYSVIAGELVQLMGLAFYCLTMEPVYAVYNHSRDKWPGNLVDRLQTFSWWQTNHLSWCALVVGYCPDVWVELENSWVPAGKTGRKCKTWMTELFLKWTLCALALVLLYFLYFILNWWNPVGWHGKHLLDNQHCIHRKTTEYTLASVICGRFECWTSLVPQTHQITGI